MSVMQHLEELRVRLFKMVLAFLATSIVAWLVYDRILAILIAPLKTLPESKQLLRDGKLIFTSPPEAFFVRLKVVAAAGLFFALPIILWQLWRFITPGLYKREKRLAIPFVGVSILLFAMGSSLAMITMPQALRFLVSLAGSADFVLLPRASEYLSFTLLLVMAFGLTFEFPLVLIFLSLVGVITSRGLRRQWRLALILVLLASAVVTPTQDPFTMAALSIPLYLLYEGTIIAVKLLKR